MRAIFFLWAGCTYNSKVYLRSEISFSWAQDAASDRCCWKCAHYQRMAERNRNEGVPQLSAAFRPSPQQQWVCKVQLRRYVTHANYHIYNNACICALKRMLLKKSFMDCSCFQMGWISWSKIQFEGIFCQMKFRRWKIWMANMKTENLRGNTTLQFTMNGKLSQHGFGHCHENGLIKTIQTVPHNL